MSDDPIPSAEEVGALARQLDERRKLRWSVPPSPGWNDMHGVALVEIWNAAQTLRALSSALAALRAEQSQESEVPTRGTMTCPLTAEEADREADRQHMGEREFEKKHGGRSIPGPGITDPSHDR